jgi:hypothetical protein
MSAVALRVYFFITLLFCSPSLFAPSVEPLFVPTPIPSYESFGLKWMLRSLCEDFVDVVQGKGVDSAYSFDQIIRIAKQYFSNYKKVERDKYQEVFTVFFKKQWPKRTDCETLWQKALIDHNLNDDANWSRVDAHVMALVTFMAIVGEKWLEGRSERIKNIGTVKKIVQGMLEGNSYVFGEEEQFSSYYIVLFGAGNRDFWTAIESPFDVTFSQPANN